MKRETRRSRWKALLWQLACALVLTMMVGSTALAASTPVVSKTLKLYLGAEPETISLKNGSGQAFAAENIKVGNKKTVKVETVKNAKGKTLPQLRVTPLKEGSTTVKFDLKRGTTTRSYSVKVTVLGDARPFSSFKIGSRDFTSSLSSDHTVCETYTSMKGKLSIQMNKGWTLKSVTLRTGNPEASKAVKKVKNNSTVSLQRSSGNVLLVMAADKDGKELGFFVMLKSPEVTAPALQDFHASYVKGGDQNGLVFNVVSQEDTPLEIRNVKSSNTRIATVSTYYVVSLGCDMINVDAKKAGTVKVSFQANVNGKWKNCSLKVYFHEYENPFTYLKIGSKDYAGKFNTRFHYQSSKTLKGKLNIKLKEGWKLESISYYPNSTSEAVSLKNKKELTLKKTSALQIVVSSKKYPMQESFWFNVSIWE